jgi:regulator of nonsense transcripts 2
VTDFFRVRLACAILDTCGLCFAKGSLRRKLDQYLIVLQLYAVCKTEMPLDVEFMLDDLLETLRPDGRPKGSKDGMLVPRLRTFTEAAAAVDEMLVSNGPDLNGGADESDDEGEDNGKRAAEDDEDELDEPSAIPGARIYDDEDDADDDDDDDRVVIREQRHHDEFDEQAAADFDREFARMLADTTSERKAAPVFDQAVPMFRKRQQQQHGGAGGISASGSSSGAPRAADESMMQFMLLSKKGNKSQVS